MPKIKNNFLRKLSHIILACGLFVAVERLTHKATDGFTLHRMTCFYALPDHLASPKPSTELQNELASILSQEFSYLACGSQSFAFESKDQRYILKFVKHHRFRMPFLLDKLPLPKKLAAVRAERGSKKLESLYDTLSSFLFSFQDYQKETGVIYAHPRPTDFLNLRVTIVDKLNIRHQVALDEVSFLIQKKAESVPSFFLSLREKKEHERAKAAFDALLEMTEQRSLRGYLDKDPHLIRNFGFIEGTPVEIDAGGFVLYDRPKPGRFYYKEIHKVKAKALPWFEKNYPEIVDYVVSELNARIEPRPELCDEEEIDCDVAIVGGGLSGLIAGSYLLERGYNVHLFEAQNYPGGRIRTRHLPCGTFYEEGAFSFIDKDSELLAVVSDLNLPLTEHTSHTRFFFFKGIKGKLSDSASILDPSLDHLPIGQLWKHFTREENFTDNDVFFKFLKKKEIPSSVIEWLENHSILHILSDSSSHLSTRAVMDFLAPIRDVNKIYSLKGGNDRLPYALAEKLGNYIHLNAPIATIRAKPSYLELEGGARIRAKRVILAIPPKSLKNIYFDPPLSKIKREALEKIGHTCASRITLYAKDVKDLRAKGGVLATADAPKTWLRDQSLFQERPNCYVLAFTFVGEESKRLDSLPLNEKIDLTMELLKKIDGSLCDIPWQCTYSSWNRKEWIDGGYVSFPPGLYNLRQAFAEGEGRLHFAGEHTSRQFATLNGAVQSGLRAAQEVEKSFSPERR